MNRIQRLTSILTQLQSKRILKAKELAKTFQVSLRTIYRDMESLQASGIPIGSESGVGYFLVDGYTLAPLAITKEEAHALIAVKKIIDKQPDQSLIDQFSKLTTKVQAVLSVDQKDSLQTIDQRSSTFLKIQPDTKSNWLSTLHSAISEKNVVCIEYHSLSKDEITERTIEPLATYYTNNIWVLIAYCQLREDLREFRLDRIQTLTYQKGRFTYLEPFQLNTYFKKQNG